jgi:hypothetical protein
MDSTQEKSLAIRNNEKRESPPTVKIWNCANGKLLDDADDLIIHTLQPDFDLKYLKANRNSIFNRMFYETYLTLLANEAARDPQSYYEELKYLNTREPIISTLMRNPYSNRDLKSQNSLLDDEHLFSNGIITEENMKDRVETIKILLKNIDEGIKSVSTKKSDEYSISKDELEIFGDNCTNIGATHEKLDSLSRSLDKWIEKSESRMKVLDFICKE